MKTTKILFAITLVCFLFSCGGGDKKENGDKEEKKNETTKNKATEPETAISLWGNSMREEPSRQGKWIATILFGEKVQFLGDTSYNEKEDRNYMKVKLTDGKSGWVNRYLFAVDAERAALTAPVPVYKRPDISTVADQSLERTDVIAIAEKQEEWAEVYTKEKEIKGWINNTTNITKDNIDVAVAIQVTNAKSKEKLEKQIELLEKIKENKAFESSVFYEDAVDLLNGLQMEQEDQPAEPGDSI